jgi:hypothetical protein
MAKSPKKPKQREDLNQLAARIVAEATGQIERTPPPKEKDPAAVALGAKGGAARAKAMGKKKRAAAAKQAAQVRWHTAR